MAKHSLKSTFYIHNKLISTSSITSLISENNIFLLIAEAETKYPYAVITRTRINSTNDNKDFNTDEIGFNIRIWSDKYDEAVEIADAMRAALEGRVIETDDNEIIDSITLTSSSESWTGDAYLESIDFTAEIY